MARKSILLLNESNVRGSIWPLLFEAPLLKKKTQQNAFPEKKKMCRFFLSPTLQSYNFEKWK